MFVVLIAATLLVSYLVYADIKVADIGIEVSKGSDNTWIVKKIESNGLAYQQGIRQGDRVISIDHVNVEIYPNLRLLSTVHSMVTERAGVRMEYSFPTSTLPISMDQTVLPLCLYFLLLSLSLFLLIKKREDAAAHLLIFFFLAVAISYVGAGASAKKNILGFITLPALLSQIPVIFLHFLYRYFKQRDLEIVKLRVIICLYAINLVIFLFNMFSAFTRLGDYVENGFPGELLLISFTIGIMMSMWVLFNSFRKYRNTTYSPLFKFMIFGNLLSFFPFVFLYALPSIIFDQEIISASIAAIFLFLIPIIYVYLIATNHLMDIEFVLGRLRYYCILSVIPTTIILIGVYFFMSQIDEVMIKWAQLFLTVYIGVVLFLYVKDMLDFRFRRKLFIGTYNFQSSLDRFSSQISKIMKVPDLEERLLREVLDVLPVKAAALLQVEHEEERILLKRTQGDIQEEQQAELLTELQDMVHDYTIGNCIKFESGLCCVIGKHQKGHTLLWICNKVNRVQFNRDELVWLQTISNYVSMVYENLQLIEGVIMDLEVRSHAKAPAWVLRMLFQLTEKERRRLAADLHDSALQDQLLWYRKLEMIMDETDLNAEVRDRLTQIKEGLLDVVHQIRETCNELRPPFLKEMGVVEAIDNLCNYAQFHSNYSIDFNYEGFNLELDDEYVLTIYRITQELLRNTTKHAKASNVEILLRQNHEHIAYVYRDNGVGMDMLRLQSSFKHMGLSGIRERVSGFEGETMFHSAIGEGFEVIITLPYQTSVNSQCAVAAREGLND
jgi:two-component system sensor histidine kinase ComP